MSEILQIRLSRDESKLLKGLTKETGRTKFDTVRRALELLDFFTNEKKSGRSIMIANKDGNVMHKLVLIQTIIMRRDTRVKFTVKGANLLWFRGASRPLG